jgi:acyl-CoA synthetase (AMP-forming)/AMP-acid ligase II
VSPLLTEPTRAGIGFWSCLEQFGERTALVTAGGTLSYGELADRAREVADRLGPTRRLVLLAGANELDAVVGYLAALVGGHPVIVVPGDNGGNL